MSHLVVDATCAYCGYPVVAGAAIFAAKVRLSAKPLGHCSIYRGELPFGQLRIQSRAAGKPRHLIHEDCYNRRITQ